MIPAILKLLDYVAAGIGSIAGPLLAPWAAGRHAKAALLEARGQADARRILSAAEAEHAKLIAQARAEARSYLRLAESQQGAELTGADLTAAWEYQNQKRMHNIEAVVEAAAADLGEDTVSDHDPDPDWTARFFSDVQDVTAAEMQQMWARVLAGEVRMPGTTAIRTLDILRNLDQRVAREFRHLCALSTALALRLPPGAEPPAETLYGSFDPRSGSFVLDQRVISVNGNAAHNALSEYMLGFDILSVLNEYGLIISDFNSWRDYRGCLGAPQPDSELMLMLRHAGRSWRLTPLGETPTSALKISGVALSRSGREIASVVEFEPDQQYLSQLMAHFESKNVTMVELPLVS